MVLPHQKLVGYEEEVSALHQRLVMILPGWLLLYCASGFIDPKHAAVGYLGSVWVNLSVKSYRKRK